MGRRPRRAAWLAVHAALAAALAASCSQSSGKGPPPAGDAGGADVTTVDSFLVCGDQGQPCCEGFCNGSLTCNAGTCAPNGEEASVGANADGGATDATADGPTSADAGDAGEEAGAAEGGADAGAEASDATDS